MSHSVEIVDLTKSYPTGFWRKEVFTAVDKVSFSVEEGTIFGLLGPNGAGKTSVMKMMCGLLTPSEGDVNVYGYSVRHNRRQVLGVTGSLLEGRRNLYWPLTVKENLHYFGRLKGMKQKQIAKRVDELVEMMGLQPYYSREVGKLSTGNQQKVSLAAAIIHEPKLVLLDEPTLGLDVESTLHLRELIRGLVTDRKRTVFLTTHDMHLAQDVCHEFLIMKDGKIDRQFDRSVFEVYSDAVTYLIQVDRLDGGGLPDGIAPDPQVLASGVLDWQWLDQKRVKVMLKSPSLLVPVISFLEDQSYVVRDVDKKTITLEEIFLNAKRGTLVKAGENHLVSNLVSDVG